MQRRDHTRVVLRGLGDLDDVEQQEGAEQLGQPQRQLARQPQRDELLGVVEEGVALGAAHEVRAAGAELGDDRPVAVDLGGDVGDREPDVDEPAGRPVDEPAHLLVARRAGRLSGPCCPAPRCRPTAIGRSNTARTTLYARAIWPTSAPVSSIARCTNVVPPRLIMSLTTTVVMISRRRGWPSRSSANRFGDRAREVPGEHPLEPRLVGQGGVLDALGQRHLRVGDQDRVLGRAEPAPSASRRSISASSGQELQLPVSSPAASSMLHEALVHRHERRAQLAGHAEQHVLLVVVAQHVLGDVVSRPLASSSLRSSRSMEPEATARSSRIFEVHLVVGRVDPGRVVDRIGVDPPPAWANSMRPSWREPEVAALADDACSAARGRRPAPRRSPCRRCRPGVSVEALT